jgi:MFS family permease
VVERVRRVTALPLRRNRDFALLQGGQLLSNAGSQVTAIAYPLLVLALTHSAVRAGVASFGRILPMALLAVPAGLAADRWDRKVVMIAADTLRLVAIGALATTVVVHRASFWLIVVVACIEGAGTALFNAAQPGALRAVVAREQLPDALNTETGRGAVVMIAGPPLGGSLFEAARTLPFLVDVGSYVLSTVSLVFMKTPFQEPRARPDGADSRRDRLRAGLAFTRDQPFLRVSALLYSALNFTAFGLTFSIVVIGRQQGLSGAAVGGLVAIFAVCILLGSFLSRAVRRALSVRAVLLLELWCWLGGAVFLIWPRAYVLALGLIPVGFAIPSTDSVVHSYRIAVTPDYLLGRVESLRSAIALLLGALAPLVAGVLLAATTPRWAIGFFVLWSVAMVIWGMRSAAIRAAPSLGDLAPPP